MATTTARHAVVTAIALLAVTALVVRRASEPPTPAPASAPPTEFSAERAVAHVKEIARQPRPTGTPENARVRGYLVARLRSMGLEVEIQNTTAVGTRYPAAGRVQNVLARLPGKTPGGPGVVLMSHYDGVAGGPAAGDAAAGTAAILETVRALRAGQPLEHDLMVVITDGEEAGLLGAAAFVREHPWARNVGVTLNFEARGTAGRSNMFETGPGNLDVVRTLRTAGDVSATSLSVTVYRSLPNDTDLSEIAVLGKPALNFAFVDGVERYHTTHDDVVHLDLGSLQHHGAQMVALARAFGNGPLPRPATGDAVFFDAPLLGLVLYPEGWALPISIIAAVLVLAAVVRVARQESRWIRGVALGAVGVIASVVVAGGLAMVAGTSIARLHDARGWAGAPAFRGIYTAGLAALALSVVLAGWSVVRRWATAPGAHAGALLVAGVLTLLVTVKLPGVSYLLVWPLIGAAIAALAAPPSDPAAPGRRNVVATMTRWLATVVALSVLAPIIYAVSAVSLGAVGPGGVASAVLVALLAWLLAPQLDVLSAGRPWRTAALALTLAVCLIGYGMATVRSSPEHPIPSQIVYVIDADSGAAWLGTRGPIRADVPGTPESAPPAWVRRFIGGGRVSTRPAPRVSVDGPTAEVIADSSTGDTRTVVLRVRAASGAEEVSMRAPGARVVRSAVDGRPVDTSRYRGGVRPWQLDYAAPPDSGFHLALTVPPASPLTLELAALQRPIPPLPGVTFPARPPNVVTIQNGDAMVVRRTVVVP